MKSGDARRGRGDAASTNSLCASPNMNAATSEHETVPLPSGFISGHALRTKCESEHGFPHQINSLSNSGLRQYTARMRFALAVQNRKSNQIERPSLVKDNVDGNGHLGVDQCCDRYHRRYHRRCSCPDQCCDRYHSSTHLLSALRLRATPASFPCLAPLLPLKGESMLPMSSPPRSSPERFGI